ncbi:zinc finger protein Xfin-like [Gigantopelta aegis]|uniref:zinc finger protein Xfin-like n=1 Tax=Gigantopelta aegis TaxID=1735272 RepID=UPI001B88CB85|nr:zinc finger protein Xfin-like [Gigantopelta aegis]
MGKKVLPLHRCETCGFSSKNFYIFKRHKNRCDKKIYRTVDPLPTTNSSVLQQVNDPAGLPLPPPLVNRNYRCIECGFTTNKSKIFLNHNIDSHGAKFSVFECTFCEYASRWKHKLDRHVKYAHKQFIPEEEIQVQEDGDLVKDESMPSVSGDGQTVEPLIEEQMESRPVSKIFHRGFPRISFKTSKGSKLIATKKPHMLGGFKAKTSVKKVPAFYIQVVAGADGETVYKCKLCLYSASKKKQTFKHVTACHVNASFFKCSKCDFTTDKRVEFYTHKISHASMSSGEVYKCEECSYSTYVKKNLDCHREKHGSDNPHKCSMCSYATGHEAALKRHVVNHHQNSARNESLVLGHTSSADDSFVPMETVPSESVQEEPMVIDDTETVSSSVVKSDKMTCPLCGLSFGRPADLGKHVIARHNMRLHEMRQLYQEGTLLRTDPVSTASLKPKKIGLGKDKMKCTFCSYTTKWPSDYRRHIAVHSVEKRYKCPLCMKKYKYLGDVNVHVRRDHNCEPSGIHVQKIAMVPNKKSSPALFRCPACPYITKTKMEMEKHSSTHNKEDKTFQCKQCDYQTYWRGDIGRHLYRHHGDLLPKEKTEVDLKEFMIIRPERLAFKRKPKAVRLSEMEGFNPEVSSLETVSCEPALDDTSDSLSTTSSHSPKKEAAFLGPVKCDHCPFVTNAASKLKAHVATHFNLKQFKCPICGRRSNWKWDMRKHLKREHPEVTRDVITLSVEEAKRSIGEYLETQPNIRREHHFNVRLDNALSGDGQKKVKKPFQCSLCKFRSDFRWSVSKHLRTIHPGKAGNIVVLTNAANSILATSKIDSFQTPTKSEPPTPTESPSSLDKHHHLRAPSVKNTFRQPVPSGDANMERPFMCPECGKRCTTKGDVKKHYHYAHPSLEVKVIYVPDGTEFLYTSNFTVPNSPSPRSEGRKRHNDIQTIKAKSPNKGKDSLEGSKFSNPKLHGYVKPFKCSVCHHRSNWKWDLKKHLRERHPNSCGYIILMDIAEAKDTYAEECRITDRTNLTLKKSVVPSPKSVTVTSNPEDPPTEYLPFNMTQDMSRCRRFKCSACAYRSNWRTDLLRHLKRKHSLAKTKVVLLNEEFARSTLSQYKYIRNSRDPFANKDMNQKRINSGSSGTLAIDEKIWRCSRCSFQATFRSHIIKHMQKHGMKPFQCRICEFCSNFRTNLHRHVSKLHGKSDCKPFIKVRIKYSSGFNSDLPEENTAVVTCPPEKATVMSEQYIDVFLCRKCNLQFSSALLCHRHLRETHGCDDKTQCMKFRKRQRVKVPEGEQYVLSTESGCQAPGFDRKKNYMCTLCPYTANKRGLLNFHMTYHKPQPFNKYKCKHCPYYVSRPRLLQQHTRLHTMKLAWENKQITPQSSPTKNTVSAGIGVTHTTPKKHACEKCPYSTNSKNDMLYHRQFHRPKPSAEFKCDHCDYWVTHRRLLKQHEKCHKSAQMTSPVQSSPCKSEMSENSAVLDTVEIAAWKQQFICSKITASLSTDPTCSPTKLAAQCSMGFRPGYIVKNGNYRKLHNCRSCPYMNIRARNLRLHEMMHGKRPSKHPLLKCPDCDYYVGARGLLAHHMKVHQPSYVQDFNDSMAMQMGKQESQQWGEEEAASDSGEINPQHKVDTLLEIVRFKKYCCEKCPYASAKRNHFQRHVELHGSRQRFTCDFCDYSVPSKNLLAQHRKLHLMPNQNLLTIQSLSNLQYLTEVPADVALASALPAVDDKKPVTISVTHDHLELYENIPESELEPKKLYRCDRCPYANVKRDHLLTHLKFHMIRSEISCPYCDYSVPNHQFLTQHIRVHFCPLPEFSEWLTQNGQTDRIQKEEQLDISEALEVAKKCQKGAGVSGGSSLNNGAAEDKLSEGIDVTMANKTAGATVKEVKCELGVSRETLTEEDSVKRSERPAEQSTSQCCVTKEQDASETRGVSQGDGDTRGVSQGDGDTRGVSLDEVFACQYCDREIVSSERLLRHEMQHLIGNHYEVSENTAQKSTKAKSDKVADSDDNTENTSCYSEGKDLSDAGINTEGSVTQHEDETCDREKLEELPNTSPGTEDMSVEEGVSVDADPGVASANTDADADADADYDDVTDMDVDGSQ